MCSVQATQRQLEDRFVSLATSYCQLQNEAMQLASQMDKLRVFQEQQLRNMMCEQFA